MRMQTMDHPTDAGYCPIIEIQVQRPLDLQTVSQMRERLLDALSLKPDVLIVDMADCPFFDATGINMLLDVHRQCWRKRTRFALRGCSKRHARLLALTGLHEVFEFVESDAP